MITTTKSNRKRRSRVDIAGMRSGRIVAIEPTDIKRRTCYLWRCKCDCGNEILVEPYKISRGIIQSCGCIRTEKKIKDLTNQRFGKLTALYRLEKQRGSSYLWHCRCDCGNEIDTSANALLSGNCRSCGCNRIAAAQNTVKTVGGVGDHVHFVDGTCVEKIEKRQLQKNNTSGYTGVQARGSKWIAVITFKKKAYYLGSYSSFEDAVQARKTAEKQMFGEFLERYYSKYPETKEKQKTQGNKKHG